MKKADGSALNGTNADELSAGEIEGRRQVMQFFEFLRREAPGFANAYVVDTPPQIGIRETRRICGAYQLSGDDVLSCESFPDTIGVNGWPIEAHTAGRSNGGGGDSGVARLLPPAQPHAAAAEGEEPAGRWPLRFDDA